MGHFPFVLRPSPTLPISPLQNQVDTLVERFASQAADPNTLASLVTGGLANRFLHSFLVPTVGPLFQSSPIGAFLSSRAIKGMAFFGEIGTYEITRQSLENGWNHWRAKELAGNFLQTALSLGILKTGLRLTGGQNPLLAQILPPVGLAWAQKVASSLGLIPQTPNDLAQTLLSAEAAHLQMRAGGALLGEFHPLSLSSFEFSLKEKWEDTLRSPFKNLGPIGPRLARVTQGPKGKPFEILMATDSGDRKTPTGMTGKIQIMGRGVDMTVQELADKVRNDPAAILKAFRAAKEDGNSVSLRVLAEVARTNPEAVFALHNLALAKIAGAKKMMTNLEVDELVRGIRKEKIEEESETQEQILLALHVLAEAHNDRALEALMKLSLYFPKAEKSLESLSAKDSQIAKVVLKNLTLRKLGEAASEGALTAIFEITEIAEKGNQTALILLKSLAMNPNNPSGGEILSSLFILATKGLRGASEALEMVAKAYPDVSHGERARFLLDQWNSLKKSEGKEIGPE